MAGACAQAASGAAAARRKRLSGGTGRFTLRNNGIEQGYNNNPALPSQFTDVIVRDTLPFSAIPWVEIGGVVYREFVLGMNQSGGRAGIALNDLRLYASTDPNLQTYDIGSHTLGGVAPFYDMDSAAWGTGDNTILACGLGANIPADMFVYVPESLFNVAPNTPPTYVYLYSKLGDIADLPIGFPDRATYAASAGNEEWRIGTDGTYTVLADLAVTKTDNLTLVRPGPDNQLHHHRHDRFSISGPSEFAHAARASS